MSELSRKSVGAAKWGLLTAVSKFAMQFTVNIIVARLLGPDSYGLFALASLMLLMATFISEFGLGWSLMQKIELDDRAIRFVFTWQCISGIFGATLMFFGAPFISDLLRDDRLISVVQWLGLTCLFNAIGSTAGNLLRRELRFKTLAVQQIAAYFLAYALIGLPMAVLGYGYWALVSAWVVQAILSTVLSIYARPHSFVPLFLIENSSFFIKSGSTVFLTNICNWLLTNVDRLILGRVAGSHAAGLYAVGYNLASVPNSLLIGALQPALLASGAKIQDQIPTLRKVYLEIQSFIWIVVAPLFVVISLSCHELIELLYGEAWGMSGGMFGVIVLAMPAYLALALTTPILWNTRRSHYEVMLQFPILLLAPVALIHAAEVDANMVAVVAALTFAARFLTMALPAQRALMIQSSVIAVIATRALVINGAVFFFGWIADQIMIIIDPGLLCLMLFRSVVAISPLILLLWLCPGFIGESAQMLLARFLPRGSNLARHFACASGLAGKD